MSAKFRQSEPDPDHSTMHCVCGSSFTWSGFDRRLDNWTKEHAAHVEEQPAAMSASPRPTRCRCGAVCSNPSCFEEEPATGAWRSADPNPYPCVHQPKCIPSHHCTLQSKCWSEGYAAGRRAGLLEAAKICDGIYEDEREYHGGQPDGAKKCRDKIRAMKGGEGDGS